MRIEIKIDNKSQQEHVDIVPAVAAEVIDEDYDDTRSATDSATGINGDWRNFSINKPKQYASAKSSMTWMLWKSNGCYGSIGCAGVVVNYTTSRGKVMTF